MPQGLANLKSHETESGETEVIEDTGGAKAFNRCSQGNCLLFLSGNSEYGREK